MLSYPSTQIVDVTCSFETLVTTSLHGVTSQKTVIFPVSAVRAWHLAVQFRRNSSFKALRNNLCELDRAATVCCLSGLHSPLQANGFNSGRPSHAVPFGSDTQHHINWISYHFHAITETEDSLPPQKCLPQNPIQTCSWFAIAKEKSERRMVYSKFCSGLLQPRNAQKKVREKITF